MANAQRPVVKHKRWVVHSHEATQPLHGEVKSDINITPLIDVMLVLLIIFMVVTPVAQKGVDIALPQPLRHRFLPAPDGDRARARWSKAGR